MAKLHGFVRTINLVTEYDGNDENVVPRQKPRYVRQLAMVDEESRVPDHPVVNKTEEDWPDSYDITVRFPPRQDCTKVQVEWRIHRMEALIDRFVRMSSNSLDHDVAGIYSLDGDQMEMFNSLKKRFRGRVCNMKMHSYEKFSHSWKKKSQKLTMRDLSDFLGNWTLNIIWNLYWNEIEIFFHGITNCVPLFYLV